MKKYIIYFDSGTTNSRVYLLDRDYNVKFTAKRPVGSRDSAIEGSNICLLYTSGGRRRVYHLPECERGCHPRNQKAG